MGPGWFTVTIAAALRRMAVQCMPCSALWLGTRLASLPGCALDAAGYDQPDLVWWLYLVGAVLLVKGVIEIALLWRSFGATRYPAHP